MVSAPCSVSNPATRQKSLMPAARDPPSLHAWLASRKCLTDRRGRPQEAAQVLVELYTAHGDRRRQELIPPHLFLAAPCRWAEAAPRLDGGVQGEG